MLALILPLLPIAAAAPQWVGHGGGNHPHGYPGQGEQYGDHGKHGQPYKHVITISVDGLHGSDVEKWVALSPSGNISQLLQHGYEFTNAWTTAPSDSFPGALAQYTGGTPKTTGVWYDDSYDRSFYAPSSGCIGPAGAEGVQ